MKKLLNYRVLSLAILSLLLVEIGLRLTLGLGTPGLFNYHFSYAYNLKENQNIRRNFSSFSTNRHGLRSPNIRTDRKSILKIGDSVINGGERLGNDELSSNILNDQVQNMGWQVQNVSCGSWGPENQKKFLELNPEIQGEVALLYLSSHDLYDTIGTYSPVGWTVDYPNQNPPFAIWELLESFVFNTVWFPGEKLRIEEDNQGKTALVDYLQYIKTNFKSYYVFIHPTVNELEAGEMNWKGKKLEEQILAQEMPYELNLKKMEASMYRDDIHLNEKGQEFLAEQAYQLLLSRGWIKE